MRRRERPLAALALCAVVLGACGRAKDPPAPAGAPVGVRAGVDHSDWDRLLKEYVDARGLVGYEFWKAAAHDLAALDAYLASIAAPAEPLAAGDDQTATLINAYNALTIRWILQYYPTPSIRALPDSFTARRHTVGGQKVSLDDIEHGTLRAAAGYRVHGALVCGARSCPPLRRDAYTTARLDQQLDRVMREWLDRPDLNRFDLEDRSAEISPIFEWYAEDFQKAGGLRSVLKKHTRGDVPRLLDDSRVDIESLPYDWALNDQAVTAPEEPAGGRGGLREILRKLFD